MTHLDTPLCGKCGYDLTGLAREGRCPECGSRFDRRSGLGMKLDPTPEQQGDRLTKLLLAMMLAAATLVWIGACLLLYWQGSPGGQGIGLVAVLMMVIATLTSYLRWRQAR